MDLPSFPASTKLELAASELSNGRCVTKVDSS